jgi:hypothetical protein
MMLEYQEKPIDLDNMLPLLLQQEARIEQDEEDEAEKQNSMAFASRSFKQGQGKSKKGSGCYTCGEDGHNTYEREKKEHYRNIKCYNCGKKGHMKKDCRAPKKENGESSGSGGGNGNKKTMAFTTFQGKALSKIWLLDSEATHHLSENRECFSALREVKGDVFVKGVGSEKLRVEGIGKVHLYCETEEGTVEIILKEVKYTPSADVNLASLSKIVNKGAVLHGEGKVLELQIQGETFLRAENQDNLMVIQTIQPRSRAFVISEAEQPGLWHMWFCHAGWETLAKMVQDNLVDGLPVSAEHFRKAGKTVCEPCVLGKQTKKPFPASSWESSGPFDLIHTDVCGPLQTKIPGENR